MLTALAVAQVELRPRPARLRQMRYIERAESQVSRRSLAQAQLAHEPKSRRFEPSLLLRISLRDTRPNECPKSCPGISVTKDLGAAQPNEQANRPVYNVARHFFTQYLRNSALLFPDSA